MQPIYQKLGALAIDLNSSKASGGEEQLLYAYETSCPLHQRVHECHCSGASYEDKLVYQNFQFPSHSPSNMTVKFLEKGRKTFGSSKLTKPLRERVKIKWIKELGIAVRYGVSDKINETGVLTSPSINEVNRIGNCKK